MNLSDSLGAIRCQAGEKLSSSKWFSFFFLYLIIYDPQTWIPYRNQTCFVGDLEGHLWFLRHDRHPRNLRSGILLEHFWTVKTKPASRAIKLVGLISNWHSTHGELQLEKNWEANLSERMQIRSWLEMILIQSVVFFLWMLKWVHARSPWSNISLQQIVGDARNAMDAFQNAIDGLKDLKAGESGGWPPGPPTQETRPHSSKGCTSELIKGELVAITIWYRNPSIFRAGCCLKPKGCVCLAPQTSFIQHPLEDPGMYI